MSETSHIGSVRAIIPIPGQAGRTGRAIMLGFPGLETAIDGRAYIDPTAMDDTLTAVETAGTELLIILTEESELPAGAFALLRTRMQDHPAEMLFMPIEDFSAPSEAFMAQWAGLLPRLDALLDHGGTLALCCQYGAGRSGLVSALLLIERGMSPAAAVALVRSHFEEAVESEIQHAWLNAQTPSRK